MAKIRIDYDALNRDISILDAQISRYQGLSMQRNTLLERMQDSWEGEACNAYIALMRFYMQRADLMIAVLTEYKNYMSNTIYEFTEADKRMAARINSAF